MKPHPATRRAQRGWVGLVLLLLVLVVVGVLAKDALFRYGALGGTAASDAASRHDAGPAPRPPVDATSTPSTATPIERARRVEDVVGRQADERARQADGLAR